MPIEHSDAEAAMITAVAAAHMQLDALIDGVGGETYRTACAAGGTIGGHVRHLIDFFQCLLDQGPTGTVDYDLRARTPAVEADPESARAAMAAIAQAFAAGALGAMPAHIVIRESLPGVEDRPWLASSPLREAAFCVSHAVHHLALARAAAETAGWRAPKALGVAASTLRYRGAA